MKWFVRGLVAIILVVALVGAWLFWIYARQGIGPDEYDLRDATVQFDARGIPTIEGKSWLATVEAQGYVEASERYFQMDLMRRSAGGRLAELFGEAAVQRDRGRRLEDWGGVARAVVAGFDDETKAYFGAYAAGVNRFLKQHDGRVGLEYAILRTEPEPWTEADSILILLQMSSILATTATQEVGRDDWSKALPPDWFQFLFPEDHPWNKPFFGTPRPRVFPKEQLVKSPVEASEISQRMMTDRAAETSGASNSWAWCGATGCFLANDPHLGATVPHLWYMQRLRVSEREWALGVSIPGLPGITLGMNPYLAWAFTNVGEDVDDFLIERVDGDRYLESVSDGQEVWAQIEERPFEIKVRDRPSQKGVARFTKRGPLAKRAGMNAWTSRKWLALQPDRVRAPIKLTFARTFAEMNAALDQMTVPAQNILMVDRAGNIGYRTSGTGVRRKVSGRFVNKGVDADWIGYEPSAQRPRIFLPKTESATVPRMLATANQRIWVDDYGHRWAEDRRKERISELLRTGPSLTAADMRAFQLDTKSRYHQMILRFAAQHAVSAAGDVSKRQRWLDWDGVAATSPKIFAAALRAEDRLIALCLGRVRKRFPAARGLKYRARLDSAWVIDLLEQPERFAIFGLAAAEVADALWSIEPGATPYHHSNRWQAQHPFVGRVPYVGDWFRVAEPEQRGYTGLVRVEAPRYGASTRLVWDLGDPANSRWMTPVGQSGHIRSVHYADLQETWHASEPYPVFDDAFTWWVAPPDDPVFR